MIGTEPTLGLGPANQATLFVILSPVGSYFGARHSVTLLCDPRYVRSASLVSVGYLSSVKTENQVTGFIVLMVLSWFLLQGYAWGLRSHKDGLKLRSDTLGSKSKMNASHS